MIPTRSALLAIFLTAAVVFMGVKTYFLWTDGPWDLPARPSADRQAGSQAGGPQPPMVSSPAVASVPESPTAQPRAVAPDFIIAKNLFDPERGATQTKEAEANSRAMQRLRGLVLLGTAVLGDSRYAIIQDSGAQSAGRPAPGQSSQTMRFKMGDTFEGFSLSQIQDKNVVFTNGGARVELALDYIRKVEPSAPVVANAPRPQAAAAPSPRAAPGPTAPRIIPQLPRRERLPAPPTS